MKEGEWEIVTEAKDEEIKRLAVPGGWLYMVRTFKLDSPYVGGGYQCVSQSMAFVPLPPNHGLLEEIRSRAKQHGSESSDTPTD